MLYRYIFLNEPWSLNYVVYRHFDDLKCGEKKMAEAHRVASFVSEAEANDYCAYRNEMTEKNGSDDVALIARPNAKVSRGAAEVEESAAGPTSARPLGSASGD